MLVVGSLNADHAVRTRRLPGPGETVTGSDLVVAAGGKSANQAAAAALLGADVALLGRVGDDANGRLLVERVRAAGVDTSCVERLDNVATGSAIITVDDAGENCIVVSPGANGRLTAGDVVQAHDFFAGGAVLCLCLEVGLDAVHAAARVAAAAGVTVVLNPSPSADIGDDLLRLTDVLVVNEHELADLVGAQAVGAGDDSDWHRIGRTLARRGPDRVVVTLGAAGAVVLDGGEPDAVLVHRVPAPTVEVVDTTGCGDAFLGSLASRLAVGEDTTTASRFAVRVGAFAATRPGAQSSYPTAADLDHFVARGDGR